MPDDPRQLAAADLEARGWVNVAQDLRAGRAGRRRRSTTSSTGDAYLTALDLIVHLRRAVDGGVDVGNAYEVTLVMARVLRRRLDEAADATPAEPGTG